MKKLRNARWERAFQENTDVEESRDDAVNRKATIVIEHLIQASDVAHTMQHWHVYRKWNERLFTEMYYAYRAGRAETDPSTCEFLLSSILPCTQYSAPVSSSPLSYEISRSYSLVQG
jgi:hypothetical protein